MVLIVLFKNSPRSWKYFNSINLQPEELLFPNINLYALAHNHDDLFWSFEIKNLNVDKLTHIVLQSLS